MPATPLLNGDRLRELLAGSPVWTKIDNVAATGSTNLDMAEHVAELPTGAVLLADHQDGGRGRFERAWVDTPGTNIATSVLLRPSREAWEWGWLSLLVGVAVRDGVASLAGDQASRVTLKWPNDVLVDGKKLCGILCERHDDAAVCGWGLNVTMDESELPVPTATSLLLAGLPTDKEAVMAAILTQLGEVYTAWDQGEDVTARYAASCSTIGKDVRVLIDAANPQTAVEGIATGVDRFGALQVRVGDDIESFAAADVVHLR